MSRDGFFAAADEGAVLALQIGDQPACFAGGGGGVEWLDPAVLSRQEDVADAHVAFQRTADHERFAGAQLAAVEFPVPVGQDQISHSLTYVYRTVGFVASIAIAA